jgi:hypothetical protein
MYLFPLDAENWEAEAHLSDPAHKGHMDRDALKKLQVLQALLPE